MKVNANEIAGELPCHFQDGVPSWLSLHEQTLVKQEPPDALAGYSWLNNYCGCVESYEDK